MSFAVNDPPAVITGATQVCESSTITLSDAVSGGTWSTSSGTISVGSSTGVVTGVSAGAATVSYTTGGCPSVTYDINVDPLPSSITGSGFVCEGSTTTLADATPGGDWSSSNIAVAVVGSTGIVSGVSSGSVNIIYTLTATGCQVMTAMVVNPLPAAIAGPSAVCVGSNITLTDVTPGGNFSGGAPNASVTSGGVVFGISVGAAEITYTVGTTGCEVYTTILIDPVPVPVTGPSEVCENASIALFDSDPGGTWTSANTAVATVGSSSGVVTGVSASIVDISYTLSTGCSAAFPMTVNPAPSSAVVTSGPTTFCAGNSVVITAAAGLGYTYQWSVDGGVISGATNDTYVATTSGSYTADVTNSFGCVTTSVATDVTAGFTAFINNSTPLSFCIGSNVVLTADAGAAVGTLAYQWLRNGVTVASGTGASYVATTSGLYTVVISVSGLSGSCSDTADIDTVVVNPLPVPTIGYSGTTLYTTAYPGYQWFLNGLAIPGANSMTYVPHTNGAYRVRVTDGLGCAGYSGYMNITGVGVARVYTAADVKIYPNPATDMVHIEAPVAVRTVILSMEGKQLLECTNGTDINISNLAGGLYMLVVYDTNGEKLAMQKLIKE